MKRMAFCLVGLMAVLTAVAQPRVGHTYNICDASGRMLTIKDAAREHDALLCMSAADAEAAWTQVWALTDATGQGKQFTLVNPETWMAVDQAETTATKALLTWDAEQTNSNQQFTIEETEGGILLGNSQGKYVSEQEDGTIKMDDKGTVFSFVEKECDIVFYPGATVRLVSKVFEQAIGTNEMFSSDTFLMLEDIDETHEGQAWTIRRISADAGSFIIVNDGSRMAIDMALQSHRYPVLWSASTTSDNQVVTITESDGAYLIANKKSNRYYINSVFANYPLTSSRTVDDYSLWTMQRAYPKTFETVDWQNEEIFAVNKLDGHAAYMPYRTSAAVRADAARWQKAWKDPVGADYLSLNGTWKFNYSPSTDERPTDFFKEDYDVSAWDDIRVPGCIEMQGYDRPLYINVNYPFPDNPPYINVSVSGSGSNPVGSYRRTFTLPEGWESRRTILHFGGIYSGAYVWVNGEKVGYTQGANMDAEFDVTPYVKAGDNDVSVQVIRWTDGSYLEGQDMFHMSGIHREVYLYSVPADAYIRDHVITADYSGGYDDVTLNVALDIEGDQNAAKTYSVTVYSPAGDIVAQGEAVKTEIEGEEKPLFLFSSRVLKPALWSPESPSLYTVLVSQKGDGGEEMAFATKYGFCNVEFDTKLVYVNGRREYFKGVNTQDTHPVLGRTMDEATMWRDLTLMKQANVNMVRTSHYPRTTKMNDMMLYLGIYMCDEADVECHRNWDDGGAPYKIADKDTWQPAMLDRMRRMVQRDRNNSAVVMWSMGNESYTGPNFKAGFDMIHSMDHRPVHYEGATRDWNRGPYTDIRSVMYPTQQTIRNNLNNPTQPFFFCEYAHAMGNAIGNLSDTWNQVYDSQNGIGGCIWDWVDQAIYEPKDILSGDTIAANGFPKYRSGYDFPGPHQGNFCNNGILGAERSWTPELTEVKAVYQYMQFTGFDRESGRLDMRSRLTFTPADEAYRLFFTVLRDGTPVEEKEVDMPSIEPDGEGSAFLAFATSMDDNAEYTLQVEARLKSATEWADEGYPMATGEFMLKERGALAEVVVPEGVTFTSADEQLQMFTSDKLLFRGDTSYKNVKQLRVGGMNIITEAASAPDYNDFFWNENDGYNGSYVGTLSKDVAVTIDADKRHARYTRTTTGTKCNTTLAYDIYPTGVVDLTVTLEPCAQDLRRIGVRMNMPAAYDDVEYYARGPWENYCDRMDGSYLQRVRTTVDDMYEVYAHPQSNGDHQDLRELRLVNPDTKDTLLVTTDGQVGFSLSRIDESVYTTSALHASDLTRADYIQAHFDYMVRGVGNKSCGAETALSQYRCPSSGTYTFRLRFEARKYDEASGVKAAEAAAPVTFRDGVVRAEGADIRVYDIGGSLIATGHGSVSLQRHPHGIYLVKAGSALYKFVR